MGTIYRVHCERCGAEFEHQVGLGLAYACVGCGEVAMDTGAPFRCPVCNLRYNPQDADFADKVLEVILWD
ncbi:MAG: hypothetical protein IKL67_04005 [Tidjanibacter sp.]|nr:hypothetical protein [Tidjanibacter sp.]